KRRQYHYPWPFKPWLYAIALNKCCAWFRGRSAPPVPLDTEDTLMPAARDASPAEAAIATETAVLGNRAVQQVPHQQHCWRTGQVVGATNSRAEYPSHRPYTPKDILATIYRHLGIDVRQTFLDASGRPHPILNEGAPIAELV